MLRVIFLGMDTRILDQLRRCPVDLCGAYLPPAPYWIRKKMRFLSRFPWVIKKLFKKVTLHGHLADYLDAHQIPALPSQNINSHRFLTRIRRLQPDLGLVANFGQILGASLLAIPKFGFVNMHPSLLPRYRGPDPLGHILLQGEHLSGVTWHQVTPEVDQGDILAQSTFAVASNDTIKSIEEKALHLARDMMAPLLEGIAHATIKPIPQNEAEATYYPRLTKAQKAQLKAMGNG